MLLLLSLVNNTTMYLMALLNVIDGKNRDYCIGQRCCCCSWQSTIGPHGILISCGGTMLLLFHGNQFGQSIFAWHNLVMVTSCDQNNKTIDCCMRQCIIVVLLQSVVLWRVGASQEWWQS